MSIINKIKYILNKKSEIKEDPTITFLLNDSVLENIDFGDVILAKRYNTEEEKKKIQKGHEIGLYVVVGKTQDKLICCYCTSSEGKRDFFPVGEDYKIFNNKNTYVTVLRIKAIGEHAFIKKVGHLSIDDKQKMIKKLKYHNSTYYDNGHQKKIYISYEPKITTRDIIEINGDLYLVIETDKDNIKGLKIENYNRHEYIIDFKQVNIIYDKATTINLKTYNYISTISRNQYRVIMQEYLKHKKRINELNHARNNKTLKRGYIVKYNDKLYYIYNIVATTANAFQIEKTVDTEKSIKIDKNYFIGLYDNEVNIDIKLDEYIIIDIVSDKIMESFSLDRKEYIKRIKLEQTKSSKKKLEHNFKIGDVIESNEIYEMKFIVIGIYKDIIITISLYHFINEEKIIYREFNNHDNSLSLTNTSKNELLKVKENIEYLYELGTQIKKKKRQKESKY